MSRPISRQKKEENMVGRHSPLIRPRVGQTGCAMGLTGMRVEQPDYSGVGNIKKDAPPPKVRFLGYFFQDSAFGLDRKPDGNKETGRIKIILSRLINNSNLGVTFGLLVGDLFIQLPDLQRCLVSRVVDAKQKFPFHYFTPSIF
jgi:hypothetical protein